MRWSKEGEGRGSEGKKGSKEGRGGKVRRGKGGVKRVFFFYY